MAASIDCYNEINNVISKIGRAADDSINSGKPITKNDLLLLMTQDAIWSYAGNENKGIDKIVDLWNNGHKTLIFGRHRYLQRIIEKDENDNNIYNCSWY